MGKSSNETRVQSERDAHSPPANLSIDEQIEGALAALADVASEGYLSHFNNAQKGPN